MGEGHEHDERAEYDIPRLKTAGFDQCEHEEPPSKDAGIRFSVLESNSFDVVEPFDLESRVVQLSSIV